MNTQKILSREELISRARALVPEIRAHQEKTEAERRVSDEIFAKITDAEIFKILLPRRYGGFEHGLDTFVDIGYEIARGCGSVGWVHSVCAMYHAFLGMFPGQAQDEVWGENPRAVIAASFTPTGHATPVDGGYALSGTWMYCSGMDNCPWIIVAANLPTQDADGNSAKGYALARTADFEVEDNWQVVGLAGSGSKNVLCRDMFIPAHRLLPLEDTMSGRPPGAEHNDGPLYRIPLFASMSCSLVAPIMGMAQGALDNFVATTKQRITRGAALSKPAPMAALHGIQLRIGEASASIDAARAAGRSRPQGHHGDGRRRQRAQYSAARPQQGQLGLRRQAVGPGRRYHLPGERRRRAVQPRSHPALQSPGATPMRAPPISA